MSESAGKAVFLITHCIKSDAPTAPTLTVVTNWLAGLEQQTGGR